MQFATPDSSWISDLIVDDNTVTVNLDRGDSYDYTVNDIASFVSALSDVIEGDKSVGQFINSAIRNETLLKVAA